MATVSAKMHEPLIKEDTTSDFHKKIRRLGRLFAVKPALIIYGMQYAITGPVTT